MTKFFNKFKNPVFGPFLVPFPNFWSKNIFSTKLSSVTHKFIWVSNTMPKFGKKLMMQFQENAWTDRRTEGWSEGQAEPIS